MDQQPAAGPDTRDRPAGGTDGGDRGGAGQLPSFPEQVAAQLGGWRGMVEAGIPVAFFLVANMLWELRPAIGIAVGVSLAIAVTRLVQRRPIRYVVNGLFGVGIGAVLAWNTGEARDFYLPGIVVSYGYAAAMVFSMLIRHPLVGWFWSIMFARGSAAWRGDPVLMRTLTWLTLLWAVVWVVKVSVQLGLYLADYEHALGVARIVLGAPVFALLLGLTIWIMERVQRRPTAVAG